MRDSIDLVVSAHSGAGELSALEVAVALNEIALKSGCRQ
jgi:hypothetical protein